MERTRPATLKSIADALGLNVSTVSRVLNGSADDGLRAASRSTAERVRSYADEVGYRPDPHARGLRTQRSALVAVLVPRLSDGVLAHLVEGVEVAATGLGLTAFATSTHDDPETQAERVRAALARRVDGIIVADARLDAPLPRELVDGSVPWVLANRRYPGAVSVTADDRDGGRQVAEHLLATGARSFGVVAGPRHAGTAVDRIEGFVEALGAAGCTVPDHLVRHGGFDLDSGRRAMGEILERSPDVEAVFAVDDYAAIGAAAVARERGRVVGSDLALVGYNDTAVAGYLPVPLTSVRHPAAELGSAAVEVLHEQLGGGGPATSRVLAPTLVVRRSSSADGAGR